MPRVISLVFLGGLVLVSASCGSPSGAEHVPLPAVPAPQTRATLVGPRCEGGQRCDCRDEGTPESEQPPGAAFKRFEVRVGPSQNPLWVTVDDMVLYKSEQRATDCFYIDLTPGKHPVRVHGKREQGVGVAVEINELSGGGPWWYSSFDYNCGGGGPCDMDGLRDEQSRVKALPRGILDPCGSVKIQGFNWRSGTMPDALHPQEIVVDFVLDVYKFKTEHVPGSDKCKKS
jgi:hypothetical protein